MPQRVHALSTACVVLASVAVTACGSPSSANSAATAADLTTMAAPQTAAASSPAASVSGSSADPSSTPLKSQLSASPTSQQLTKAAAALVGPLFEPDAATHGCTASVIRSTGGDLILTAAHCLSGSGAGWTFVPGFDGGSRPLGVWQVTSAFVMPQWTATQDPEYDIAVLKLAKDATGRTIQQAVGAASLGTAPPVGTAVTAIAYNSDSDTAVSCTAKTTKTQGFPEFDCDGFSGGSSGSPWLVQDASGALTVVGIIGGLNQGGCSESVSYSANFTANVQELASNADQLSQGTSLPQPQGDGC